MIESVFTTAVRSKCFLVITCWAFWNLTDESCLMEFDGMCRQRAASRLQVNATATLTNSVLFGPCAVAKVTGGLADYNNFVTATTSGRKKKGRSFRTARRGCCGR